MTYLRVRNWERFQHYKKRRPPWVKFYVELLDDPLVTRLPLATQLLLDRLLLVAAQTDNRIVMDARWIANKTHIPQRQVTDGLAQLLDIRFIIASNVLDEREQDATPETETYTESPLPPLEEKLERLNDVKTKLFAVKAS